MKIGKKRSDFDCAKIGLMTASGVEYGNGGYCADLCYYQGAESIYKAERVASKMQIDAGERLIKFITESNKKMEKAEN